MDIEGAGWAVLEQLLGRGLVHSRGDFYRLTVEQLASLERFAQKSAENLHAAIERSRRRPLPRILNALGIPQVGEQKARIMGWMTFWPWSVLWFIVNDPIRRAFHAIFDWFHTTYQRMADKAFEGAAREKP